MIFDENDRKNKELNKYLSFSCAPGKDYIEVTKRLSNSEFSKHLKGLKKGDEILIKGPLGNCIFKDEYSKIAFLIGGIGITPVISIIEYIVTKKFNTDVYLLYSNKTEDDIAFKTELDKWSDQDKNIKIIYLVTDCEPKDNKCFAGFIDRSSVTKHIKDFNERVSFIYGPPRMVGAMKNLCSDIGCAADNIKIENFIGY